MIATAELRITTRRPQTAKLKLDDAMSFDRSRVLPEYRHMSDSMLHWLADAPGRRALSNLNSKAS